MLIYINLVHLIWTTHLSIYLFMYFINYWNIYIITNTTFLFHLIVFNCGSIIATLRMFFGCFWRATTALFSCVSLSCLFECWRTLRARCWDMIQFRPCYESQMTFRIKSQSYEEETLSSGRFVYLEWLLTRSRPYVHEAI